MTTQPEAEASRGSSLPEGVREFRKKPVVIEAVQWDGTDESAAIIAAAFDVDAERLEFGGGVLDVATLEGGLSASPGDWIIRGIQGELYPVKPDIFQQTYEPATAHRESPEEGERDDDDVRRVGWAYHVVGSKGHGEWWEFSEDDGCHPSNRHDLVPATLILRRTPTDSEAP